MDSQEVAESQNTAARNEISIYQQKYWKELVSLRVHLYYLEEYLIFNERCQMAMNWIVALASSGGIGAWVIWQKHSEIWATIIASSQVVGALRSHTPIDKRMKSLPRLLAAMDEIFLSAQRDWFPVSNGELTEKEIHELVMKLKSEKSKAAREYLGQSPLPVRNKFMGRAESNADKFFENF
ncbi:MAG: hypothetical protein L3K26_00150 [Candidatus Hydrogenedentes bacterium]|nr:hypothetical protein [Candidatus Hydrogenedentota bacterium]